MPDILETSFFERDDVVQISKDLLGCTLATNINGQITKGKIVETEAYNGRTDRACHAHLNRRTKRTEVMYGPPGHAYIYLCYGIHHLFNIVTNKKGLADAVLVRAIEPLAGVDRMKERRGKDNPLGEGPGILTQSLGITTQYDGISLKSNTIWLEKSTHIKEDKIGASTRIGVDYAGEDALLPWRFGIKGSEYLSKPL